MLADLHLPVKPRSDIALINGIDPHPDRARADRPRLHRRAHDRLRRAARVRARSTRPSASPRSPGSSTSRCTGPRSLYGKRRPRFIAWTMGVNHSTQGTETVNAINNLALITGNIGRAGASPFSITGQCNAMGTREAGFASCLPGYRKFENAADREELAALWDVPSTAIPTARGLAYPDIIERAVTARSRRSGSSPPTRSSSFPNRRAPPGLSRTSTSSSSRTAFTRRRPPSSPTSFCPPRSGARRKAPTPTRNGASARSTAVEPPGEARPTSTSSSTSPRSSAARRALSRLDRPADAFEEWRRVSQGRLCDYSGMTYEAIEAHGGIQWPFPEGPPTVHARLYTDGSFRHADGKRKAHCRRMGAVPRTTDDEFPFVLNTGRTVEHWHTRTKTGRCRFSSGCRRTPGSR